MSTPSMVIIGNLTADPELRFTPSGTAVANFTVASTAKKKNQQTGEWEDDHTTFIRCSAWEQMAENVAETLLKGMRVVVTGRLKVRQYEANDGAKGTSVECNVEEVGPSLKWRQARCPATSATTDRSGRNRRATAHSQPTRGRHHRTTHRPRSRHVAALIRRPPGATAERRPGDSH